MLSLCLGFVTWKKFCIELDEKNREWTLKDMVVDMIWNVLAITSRVLALALFAGYQPWWFWGLIFAQLIIVAIIEYFGASHHKSEAAELSSRVFVSLFASASMMFNLFWAFHTVPFLLYFVYWLIMFAENVEFISLWFYWSTGLGLRYHEAAITYVIAAYALSFIVHSVHMCCGGEVKVEPEEEHQEYVHNASAPSLSNA